MRNVHEARQQESKRGRLSTFSLMSIRKGQRMVVRACGRLVLGHGADAPRWSAHLDQATVTDVALDLSCVNDVDARGVGLLAELVGDAHQRGRTVSVIAASWVVQRLGEMTRLDRVLPGTWHERIGVLSCRTEERGKPGRAAVREFRSSGCGESRAAA